MPTAGSILSNVRAIYGDQAGDAFSDGVGLDWLDRSQRRFCHRVMPLDEFQDFVIVAKVPKFDVAADLITAVNLMWYQSTTRQLKYTSPADWVVLEEAHPNSTGTPERYTFIRRQLIVGPQVPSTRSATALASGAIFASATSFALTAASGTFRSKGFLKVGTEVVEYHTISGATVSGITRGVHNTTAASVASGDTVTQIDLICQYRKSPAVLSASTSTPEIPAYFHDYLEKYALYLAWLARGDTSKADRAYAEFEQYERDAIKTIGRRAMDGMVKIRNRPWRGVW